MSTDVRFFSQVQEQILQIYNTYRLIICALLLAMYGMGVSWPVSKYDASGLYPLLICAYAICDILLVSMVYQKRQPVAYLITASTILDVFFLNLILLIIGSLSSGFGIFINVAVAAVAIMLPGRIALFFASISTLILFLLTALPKSLGGIEANYFFLGVHGIGIFATALTAQALAFWIRNTEAMARLKNEEVSHLQKLNEYIIDRLHSGILLIDRRWQVQMINESACNMFNVTSTMKSMHISHISKELANKLDQWNKEPTNRLHNVHMVLSDPELIAHFIPSRITQDTSVLIILDDMRRMVQHAQQLKLASLGRFTASIAHELRNPLAAIDHAVQLLLESNALTKEDQHLALIMKKNSDRMNSVIKNILQLSRRKKSTPQEIKLYLFLSQTLDDFKKAHKGSPRIELRVEPENLSVFMDKSQLLQILTNLIENSIHYGKVDDRLANIQISAYQLEGKSIRLDIIDDGPGIDEKNRSKIFEPFYTTSRSGIGMGLYITKELCEANQAQIKLVDKSEGCCFRIEFNKGNELII